MSSPIVELAVQPFTLYSLRTVPLWDGDDERIELGRNLQEIVAIIVREKSVKNFISKSTRPMRLCMIEQEEAIYLPHSQKTFYSRERRQVWKMMVPASGIYSRETILTCIARNDGWNIEKYQNVLYQYPQTGKFYTGTNDEIRPVDDAVFVIEQLAR